VAPLFFAKWGLKTYGQFSIEFKEFGLTLTLQNRVIDTAGGLRKMIQNNHMNIKQPTAMAKNDGT